MEGQMHQAHENDWALMTKCCSAWRYALELQNRMQRSTHKCTCKCTTGTWNEFNEAARRRESTSCESKSRRNAATRQPIIGPLATHGCNDPLPATRHCAHARPSLYPTNPDRWQWPCANLPQAGNRRPCLSSVQRSRLASSWQRSRNRPMRIMHRWVAHASPYPQSATPWS